MKSAVTIKAARGLPKLGLSLFPSAYVIMKVGSQQQTTGICACSCNPVWNHFAQLTAQDEIEKITFYVYNNNPNHIDELLGVGYMEFEQLMTRVVTTSRVMLRNSTGIYLTSWLQIQHCNANPSIVPTPKLSQRSTIKLNLISISAQNQYSRLWLNTFPSRYVSVIYGAQRRQITEASPTDTLVYDSTQSQIQVQLQLNTDNVLKGSILFENLCENCSMRVKLYQDNYQVELILNISLIELGVLSQKFNTLIVQASNISFELINNPPKQWTLMIYSIFGSIAIRKKNEPIRIYIQNLTNLYFQFYEQSIPESTLPVTQPFCSCSVSVNSINWSTTLNCKQPLKMYNSSRGAVVNIDLNLTVVKNTNDSGLLPQFASPSMQAGEKKGIYKTIEIKMFGACFNQIFTDKTKFYFLYMSNFGNRKVVFPIFQIRNSIEYTIPCKHDIYEDGLGGHLYLLTYDHFLGKEQSPANDLENYLIFKLPCQSLSDLTQAQPIFHQNFLAFAKKQSLVKPCKKLEVMIRDKTLKVTFSGKTFPWFQSGDLTIINCRADGGRNRVRFGASFDFNQIEVEGQWGDYMLQKPYTVHIQQSGVQFNIKSEGVNLSLHHKFQEIFLHPSRNNNYMKIKVTIFYTFTSSKQPTSQVSPTIFQLQRFTASTPLHMKVKSAFISVQGYTNFSLRVSKGCTVYQTLQQNSCSNTILFKDYQIMRFGKQAVGDYLFFNLYCKNAENGIVIYAGYISARQIIGKGEYQVWLQQLGVQNSKGACLITFAVQNDTPLDYPCMRIRPRVINASHPQLLKSILKYYLVCQLNHNPSAIFQLTRSEDTLTTNQSIAVRSQDEVVWRLYSSTKQLSKQGFWLSSTEKELIAVHNLSWTDLSPKGMFSMRYMPTKQLCLKLNANKLAVLQNTVKIVVSYQCSPEQQPQIVPINRKPLPSIDIDVFHKAAARITVLEVLPLSSHEKTVELQLLPFSLELRSQSRSSPNKSYIVELDNMSLVMEAIKTSKNNDKYIKNMKQIKVDFKGRRIKTQQKVGFSVQFESVCIMRANIVVISTKFTNNCQGILQLIDFGSDNMQFKQVEIYPLESERLLRTTLSGIALIKPPIVNPKNISLNLPIATSTITFSLYFVVTLQDGQKIKSLVNLVDIPIDKLDDKPFRYEWLTENKDKGNGTFYINAKYQSQKNQAFTAQIAAYHIQKTSGQVEDETISVNSKQKSLILSRATQTPLLRPDRKRGYRLLVRLPAQIKADYVSAVLQQGILIPLRKAQFNSSTFIYSSDKIIKPKSLQIDWPELEKLEELEQKNFTRRFLVNRSPNLIVNLLEQPYAIAECKPQSMTVSFMFHFFNFKQQGKMMWTKSNKNDQILTRQFGLLVRHGNQTEIIRPINQKGQFQQGHQKTNNKCQVTFGFNPQFDEIEIYLFITHVLNQNKDPSYLFDDKLENWTKLFPVAYGKISLEKVIKDSLVGCEMRKIENYNETLDKPLNDIIVMPTLNCLGSISFANRKWSCIQVQLLQIQNFQFQSASENDLLSLQIQIENGKRVRHAGIKTEARSFAKRQKIVFLYSKFNWFYLQQIGQSENLKITACILKFNSELKIFEKRSNLFEVLREPGNHEFMIQVKPEEAKGTKGMTHLRFKITNLPQWPTEPDIVQEARKLNKVDVVSFEQLEQSDMISGMLGCQNSTHLRQVLKQVKQSVIYLKDTQLEIFRSCCYYLQFQCDQKLISIVLEILNLQLFKHPEVVSKLNQKQVQSVYQYIKILFSTNSIPREQVIKKINSSEYDNFIQNTNKNDLEACIKFQKKRLYSAQEISQPSSNSHQAKLFPIIETFVSQSQTFRVLLKKDIKAWEQMVELKSDDTFSKFLILLQKIYGFKDEKMPEQLIEQVLRLGLKKNSVIHPLVMLWTQLGTQKMNIYSKQLINKIVSKFEAGKDSQSVNQSFRIFLNYLQMNKLELDAAQWKTVASKCQSLLQENNDFFTLNMYGEILLKLDSLGKVAEDDKFKIIGIMKKKYATESDKNIKVCLGNFIDKLCGKKKATEQEAVAAKAKFYKKYLITS